MQIQVLPLCSLYLVNLILSLHLLWYLFSKRVFHIENLHKWSYPREYYEYPNYWKSIKNKIVVHLPTYCWQQWTIYVAIVSTQFEVNTKYWFFFCSDTSMSSSWLTSLWYCYHSMFLTWHGIAKPHKISYLV